MSAPQLLPNPRASRGLLPSLRPVLITGSVALGLFVVLATIVALAGGSDALDTAVYAFVQAHPSAGGSAFAAAVTALGSYQFVIVLTVLTALAVLVLSRRLTQPLVLLVSAPVASSLVFLIKVGLGRARPPSAALMGESPTDYSFPSGHTTSGSVLFLLGSIVLASRLQARWARITVRAAGIVIAVAIGASRVVLGYHWTTDVVAGWLLATTVVAAGIVVVTLLEDLRPNHLVGEVVTPQANSAPSAPHRTGRPSTLDADAAGRAASPQRPGAAADLSVSATVQRSGTGFRVD